MVPQQIIGELFHNGNGINTAGSANAIRGIHAGGRTEPIWILRCYGVM